MAIPEFVLALRAKVGRDPLPLPGVTAVVLDDDDRVLLVRRSDNGQWALVTGCLEPGEQPAAGALREIAEETAVEAVVESLLGVEALDLVVCPNGDQVYWLDTAFRCRAAGGAARVGDDESLEVAWFAPEAMPELPSRHARYVALALDPEATPWFK
ncbi:NUDIX hydrolase [Longispora albida]|uniref:NUDIX hydrolase n=1 Tax=Longispora albida TaxID=203523 RepID=UPI0003AAE134|nr:NUDIX domain-containing protein [Longispora albida]